MILTCTNNTQLLFYRKLQIHETKHLCKFLMQVIEKFLLNLRLLVLHLLWAIRRILSFFRMVLMSEWSGATWDKKLINRFIDCNLYKLRPNYLVILLFIVKMAVFTIHCILWKNKTFLWTTYMYMWNCQNTVVPLFKDASKVTRTLQ